MIEKLLLTIILFAIIFGSIFIFIFEVKTHNKIKHLKKGIEDLKKELEKND